MNEFKDPKEMRMAMNGKLGLVGGGVILLLSAITSTLMYGLNMFHIVSEVSKGNSEYVEMLEKTNLSTNLLLIAGICFVVVAVTEIFAGMFGIRLSNRLDKCFLMKKIVIVLMVVEFLVQVFLFFTGLFNFSMLITSILVPVYMFWSVTRLCKIAKAYPDRTYVTNKQKKPSASANPAPKKSLHERAMMPASLSDTEETETASPTAAPIPEEAQETVPESPEE